MKKVFGILACLAVCIITNNVYADGACCDAYGECSIITAEECCVKRGSYLGDDIVCPGTCVLTENEFPVADAGDNQEINDGVVDLDGSGSYDPDGLITSYEWEIKPQMRFTLPSPLGAPRKAEGVDATVVNIMPGIYNVTLTVTDCRGLTSTDEMELSSCFISTLW